MKSLWRWLTIAPTIAQVGSGQATAGLDVLTPVSMQVFTEVSANIAVLGKQRLKVISDVVTLSKEDRATMCTALHNNSDFSMLDQMRMGIFSKYRNKIVVFSGLELDEEHDCAAESTHGYHGDMQYIRDIFKCKLFRDSILLHTVKSRNLLWFWGPIIHDKSYAKYFKLDPTLANCTSLSAFVDNKTSYSAFLKLLQDRAENAMLVNVDGDVKVLLRTMPNPYVEKFSELYVRFFYQFFLSGVFLGLAIFGWSILFQRLRRQEKIVTTYAMIGILLIDTLTSTAQSINLLLDGTCMGFTFDWKSTVVFRSCFFASTAATEILLCLMWREIDQKIAGGEPSKFFAVLTFLLVAACIIIDVYGTSVLIDGGTLTEARYSIRTYVVLSIWLTTIVAVALIIQMAKLRESISAVIPTSVESTYSTKGTSVVSVLTTSNHETAEAQPNSSIAAPAVPISRETRKLTRFVKKIKFWVLIDALSMFMSNILFQVAIDTNMYINGPTGFLAFNGVFHTLKAIRVLSHLNCCSMKKKKRSRKSRKRKRSVCTEKEKHARTEPSTAGSSGHETGRSVEMLPKMNNPDDSRRILT